MVLLNDDFGENSLLSKGNLPPVYSWKLAQKLVVWNKVQLALQNSNGNYGLTLLPGKKASELFADIAPLQKQLSGNIAWVSTHPTDVVTATYVLQNMRQYVSDMNEISKIVQPYHKKLLHAYNELKLRKRQLEVNKKIVEDLNNAQSLMIAGINAGVWDNNMLTGRERWSKKAIRVYGRAGKGRQ